MRSRSVSRRSAPSSCVLERSLSRIRSRSAHREQDDDGPVSQAAAARHLQPFNWFLGKMLNSDRVYVHSNNWLSRTEIE